MFLLLAPFFLLLDVVTKELILAKFYLGESIPIIDGFFNLVYVRNTGAAFGMLAEANPSFRVPFFLTIPFIALAVIAWIFKKLPPQSLLVSSALSLVMAGAVGNLLDRLRHGYVVDFLLFHWKNQAHFPAFNVADSAITVGVGLMILDMFVNQPPAEKGKKA